MTDNRRAPLLLLSICVFFAICTEMLPVGLLPEIGRGLGVSQSATGVLVSLYAVLVAVHVRTDRSDSGAMATSGGARGPAWRLHTQQCRLRCCAQLRRGDRRADAWRAGARRLLRHCRRRGGLARRSLTFRARISIIMVGNALALVFGVPLGTVLGTALGWRWAFVVLAAVLGGLAVAVVRVLPAQVPAGTTLRTPVLAAIRRPAVLVMASTITLLALGHFTLYTYISPLLLHDGVARGHVGAVLFGYGCGGLLGVAAAGAVVARRPEAALAADIVLMGVSLVLAAAVASTAGIIAVVAVWGVAFGAFPTLTQTVMLRAAVDATDAASALVNATTNIGIAGGALLGSGLLGIVAVPGLGWAGAGLVAAPLVVHALRLRPAG